MQFSFFTVAFFLIIFFPLSAQSSRTEMGHNIVEMTLAQGGHEEWIQHHQEISGEWGVDARYDRVERFDVHDASLYVGIHYRQEKDWALNVTAGGGDHGLLLPQANVGGEFYKSIYKGITGATTLQYRKYRDAQVNIVSLGADIESFSSLILISRLYLGQASFEEGTSNGTGVAWLLKVIGLLPHEHRIWTFVSSGMEGVLRYNPPIQRMVSSWSAGLGGSISINNSWSIVPEMSVQKYQSLGLEIQRIGMMIEVKW